MSFGWKWLVAVGAAGVNLARALCLVMCTLGMHGAYVPEEERWRSRVGRSQALRADDERGFRRESDRSFAADGVNAGGFVINGHGSRLTEHNTKKGKRGNTMGKGQACTAFRAECGRRRGVNGDGLADLIVGRVAATPLAWNPPGAAM